MNKQLFRWGVMMVLLLVIAVTSTGLIFSPVVNHAVDSGEGIGIVIPANPSSYSETNGAPFVDTKGRDYGVTPSALTEDGLLMRVEAWKTYPEYNIGLGFIGLLAFAGAVYVCKVMYEVKEVKSEDA